MTVLRSIGRISKQAAFIHWFHSPPSNLLQAMVSDFDMHFIDTSTDGRGRYQLDVDINTLVFQHHHLFSREHVLAAQLTQQYQHYMWRSQKQLVKFLRQKVVSQIKYIYFLIFHGYVIFCVCRHGDARMTQDSRSKDTIKVVWMAITKM